MTFCDWVLSLSVIFSSFYEVAFISTSFFFFFLLNGIPLYRYITIYVIIFQLLELGFQCFALMNDDPVNIHMQISVWK